MSKYLDQNNIKEDKKCLFLNFKNQIGDTNQKNDIYSLNLIQTSTD